MLYRRFARTAACAGSALLLAGCAHQSAGDGPRFVDELPDRFVAVGHVDPKIMISNVVGLDGFPAMFDRLLGPDTENKVQLAPQ